MDNVYYKNFHIYHSLIVVVYMFDIYNKIYNMDE